MVRKLSFLEVAMAFSTDACDNMMGNSNTV